MDERSNQIALINAEIQAIRSELDKLYKDKISELESRSDQPFQPDMQHQDKVVQKGVGGAEAKVQAEEYMRTYKPAQDLARGMQQLVLQRDQLLGKASRTIRWFRTAANEKIMKSPKPAKVPRVPKPPKTPAAPTKPKKILGPKSPTGFKKKLYIPKRLIQAAGVVEYDNSPAAVANLMRYMAENGLRLSYVEWVNPSPSDRCDYGVCNELNGEMRVADLSELLKGITGWSHPGCDCHIVVTLDNGESHKITIEDDMAHLQWMGTPRHETDVTPDEQDAFVSDFSNVSPEQQRYMAEHGLGTEEPEPEIGFEEIQ